MIKTQPSASHYIHGRYVEDHHGVPLDSRYPANGEVIAKLHAATPTIIAQAIESAHSAQREWAALSGTERGRVLLRAANIMRERNEALSLLETYDTGKPIQETRVADATSGADALEYFGGMAATLTGDHIQLGTDWAYTKRIPLGVCVGIGAWNYPTQIACWKLAPALACGNTMIFKPSELTPLCALHIAEILTESGAPPGVFNVIQGYSAVGEALIQDERIAKVSLTGSVPTGRKVYQSAAQGMKHVTMELGGKSPLIIFDDASLEETISSVMLGNFYASGQVCSNGTRVFVQRSIKAAFVQRLLERVSQIRLGDPLDPETQFGPLISAAQRDQVAAYIASGLSEGATLVAGGKAPDGDGYYLYPTVFTDVDDGMTIAREEIFGPVLSILDFNTEEEVIRRANASDYGLAAGVFTHDLRRAHRVIDQLDAGTCFINSYNVTPVAMPFGGVKLSGVGRENGKAAIEHYSQLKSVYVGMTPATAPY